MSGAVRYYARYLEGDPIPPGWEEWGREVIPSLPNTPIVLVEREGEPSVKHDPIEHPAHYTSSPAKCKCGRPIECIDVTRHLNFNLGCAVKYVWRVDLKNKPIEDLEKAIWYLRDEIERRKKQEK